MSLLDLPEELISRICRPVGLCRDSTFGYKNKDFQSLRSACRALYYKTTFDAAIRYGPLLEDLEIEFNYRSLCDLLVVAKIPAFRDKINAITFYTPDRERHEKHPPGLTDLAWQNQCGVWRDEMDFFKSSSEAVHLLAECFRFLRYAKTLSYIGVMVADNSHILLAALAVAQFPRRIAYVRVEPEGLLNHRYGDFGQSPSFYLPYIDCLEICGGEIWLQSNYQPIGVLLQDLGGLLAENEDGYHVKSYRLRHSEISRFLAEVDGLPSLCLEGCKARPRLRFCNGCHDLFAYHIATASFSQLTTFKVTGMYVSGGRLRRFIKKHADTLNNVDFRLTTLTDGSWRSIAQGLLKLPSLTQLTLGPCPWQKNPAGNEEELPETYWTLDAFEALDGLSIPGSEHIRRYLEAFVKYFSTEEYEHDSAPRKPLPKYEEVQLFYFPDAPRTYMRGFQYLQPLREYMKAVEGS